MFEKKVADVIKVFTKAVDDLNMIADKRAAEEVELTKKLSEVVSEKDKARSIKAKLEELLG